MGTDAMSAVSAPREAGNVETETVYRDRLGEAEACRPRVRVRPLGRAVRVVHRERMVAG